MRKLETGALVAAGVGVAAWLLSRTLRSWGQDDFHNKVVLITGGSRGLGLVLARRLAEQGARLAICARDADELRRAADDLAKHGAEPLALPCDVTIADAVRDFARQVEDRFGTVDVLVNNASIIQVGRVEDMTRQDFEQAAVTVQSLFPQLFAGLTEMAARLLPGPAGDTHSREGKDCNQRVPSWLVALRDWAARQNNEIAPAEHAAGRRGA